MKWTFEMIQKTPIIIHKMHYGLLFHNPHVGCVKKILIYFLFYFHAKLYLNAYFHNSFMTMQFEIAKVGKVHHLI